MSSVVATGYVIDAALVGGAEARRRVLAVWSPHCRVHADGDRFVVSNLAPHRVRTKEAPGEPTTGLRSSVFGLRLEVDVSAWLDLDALAVADVKPLADPPRVVAIPVAAPVSMRALANLGAVTDDADAFAAALRGEPDDTAAPALGLFARISSRIRAWWGARKALSPGTSTAIPAGASAGGTISRATSGRSPKTEDRRPSLLDRLRHRIALALWRSRLGQELGRRHADYLRRTLDLFDRGDLDEALRHAVPVGGGADGPIRLGVQTPKPRDKLALSLRPRRGGSTIPVGDSAIDLLRDRYRAAAARLEREGRIDEAAFVVADLLGDVPAAVALLERHQRYELAARLADGHSLDPGLVVRLWFLANDPARAVAVARLRDAWADAVTRLEKDRHPLAPQVRLLHADALAEAGNYYQAVQTALPAKPSRALLLAWIDRGLAGEGPVAARLLVHKLVHAPESFPDVAPRVLDLVADTDVDAARIRRELADEVLGQADLAPLRALARPITRALVADSIAFDAARTDPNRRIERLIQRSRDVSLRTDLPPLVAPAERTTQRFSAAPLVLRWDASNCGSLPIHDAVMLPGDRFVVALGELGARLLARGGSTLVYLDQPAHRLAVADTGTRAIAIAPRGDTVARLAHLDFATRRAAYWTDADCDAASFIAQYDGSLVEAVRRGRELVAADVSSPRFTAGWGVDIESPILALHRLGAWLAVEMPGEVWLYEQRTLRERLRVSRAAVSAYSIARKLVFEIAADGLRCTRWHLPLDVGGARRIVPGGDHLAIDHGDKVTFVDVSEERPRVAATLHLDGATRTAIRWNDEVATIADDRGRVIALDLVSGSVRRDLRVHA